MCTTYKKKHEKRSKTIKQKKIQNIKNNYFQRRWRNLWIETDSALVVMAFKNATLIPCNLRNRWYNCKLLLNAMNFIVSHIYREGNQCADRLAALGLTIQNLTIWSEVPLDIREFYVKNHLGMPNFRFINF